MLKWLDEFGWMAATLDFPGSTFVTVGMDEISFKKRIENGSILRFIINPERIGKTSVTYAAKVYTNQSGRQQDEVFSTKLTFVNIDENGESVALPTNCQYNSQKKENELLF